jgi:hypothetical protein
MPSAERAAEPGTTLIATNRMLEATRSVSAKARRRERIRLRKGAPQTRISPNPSLLPCKAWEKVPDPASPKRSFGFAAARGRMRALWLSVNGGSGSSVKWLHLPATTFVRRDLQEPSPGLSPLRSPSFVSAEQGRCASAEQGRPPSPIASQRERGSSGGNSTAVVALRPRELR